MTTKHIQQAAVAALGASLLLPAFAFAQASATLDGSANVTPTSAQLSVRAKVAASSTAETTRAANAKDKADQEIDRRIASLTALATRVDAMVKVTADLKTALKTNITNQINLLTQLKAKVDADTDLATLKTDVQSITKDYRIYMLILPQARITAAADRMETVINMTFGIGTKLSARITDAKNAGNDTAALEASLADISAKLTSADKHAQAAVSLIAGLQPDNGDKTVQASNETAIKNAQTEIKGGTQDLTAARKDIADILKGLKGMKASASASSTVQAQ